MKKFLSLSFLAVFIAFIAQGSSMTWFSTYDDGVDDPITRGNGVTFHLTKPTAMLPAGVNISDIQKVTAYVILVATEQEYIADRDNIINALNSDTFTGTEAGIMSVVTTIQPADLMQNGGSQYELSNLGNANQYPKWTIAVVLVFEPTVASGIQANMWSLTNYQTFNGNANLEPGAGGTGYMGGSVPEPTTGALVAMGCAALLLRRRREK